jgi:hypothetical protein
MLKFLFLFLLTVVTSACGGFKLFTERPNRDVASHASNHLLKLENQSFAEEINQRLLALHSYNLIGLRSEDSKKQAAITQKSTIEQELLDINLSLKGHHPDKNRLFMEKIKDFAAKSTLAMTSLGNLSKKLGLSFNPKGRVSTRELEVEYASLSKLREFQIFETNIEHLSLSQRSRPKN